MANSARDQCECGQTHHLNQIRMMAFVFKKKTCFHSLCSVNGSIIIITHYKPQITSLITENSRLILYIRREQTTILSQQLYLSNSVVNLKIKMRKKREKITTKKIGFSVIEHFSLVRPHAKLNKCDDLLENWPFNDGYNTLHRSLGSAS